MPPRTANWPGPSARSSRSYPAIASSAASAFIDLVCPTVIKIFPKAKACAGASGKASASAVVTTTGRLPCMAPAKTLNRRDMMSLLAAATLRIIDGREGKTKTSMPFIDAMSSDKRMALTSLATTMMTGLFVRAMMAEAMCARRFSETPNAEQGICPPRFKIFSSNRCHGPVSYKALKIAFSMAYFLFFFCAERVKGLELRFSARQALVL